LTRADGFPALLIAVSELEVARDRASHSGEGRGDDKDGNDK